MELGGVGSRVSVRWGGTCCRGRTSGVERIAGFAGIAFEVAQDPINNPGLVNERDNLHGGAAGTQQWVHLEDFVQAAKKKTAKNFADSRGIDRGKIEELSSRNGGMRILLPLQVYAAARLS
jgi:hypothetical protein